MSPDNVTLPVGASRHGYTKKVLLSTLLIIAIPVGFTWHTVNKEKLNRSLLSAIKSNDTDKVIDLLQQGADANAVDTPQRRLSWWRTLLEVLN